MGAKCPIDTKRATGISALLTPPPLLQVQEYFEELISERQCHGIEVRQDDNFGKGVYATMDFKEQQLILKDKKLVGIQHIPNKLDCFVCGYCFRFVESIEYQIGRKLYLRTLGVSTSNGCDDGQCSSSSCKDKVCLPEGVTESLMNGEFALPYSDKFPLPSAVPCPGGCEEAYYCSKSCAEADWDSSHSLLCTGEGSESVSRDALLKFIKHATETNDIFFLAAKTISFTILRYKKLKAAEADRSELSLLLEAWKPVSIGHKRRWWDCVSFSDDADCSDESAYRMQIQELAFASLQLLKAAIFDEDCEPLFSLEIYGNIIGMFELNNLDLVVPSPVEDYFLYIDDLPDSERREVEKIAQPLLGALGDEYSICCQGTAFYPLQSCMNHSCCPNAHAFKRDEDRDGESAIIAIKTIKKGEEITISYIDEELPFEERQAALADYGFKCQCDACLKEDPNQT